MTTELFFCRCFKFSLQLKTFLIFLQRNKTFLPTAQYFHFTQLIYNLSELSKVNEAIRIDLLPTQYMLCRIESMFSVVIELESSILATVNTRNVL
jgi:hypothetical protein